MKKAYIVYCHPEPKSFVGAMVETARTALERDGWQVGVSDLYRKGFNPVASAGDFGARSNPEHLVYGLEQRHACATGTLAPDIAEEVDAVLAADLLVLAFPVFWFSMPAMLKGWIDRVFLSGTFYGGKRVYNHAGMVGKKALVITSLGGREHMFGPQSLHGELAERMLSHLLQGSLGYVGYSVYRPFVAYHVPYVDDDARRGMLAALDSEAGALAGRPLLSLPELEGFDDQFRRRVD